MKRSMKSGESCQTARRSRSNPNRDHLRLQGSSFGIRITQCQLLLERSVVIIDIVKEVNVAVLFDHNSHIEDQNRNRWSKIYLQVIPAVVHCLLNSIRVPARS